MNAQECYEAVVKAKNDQNQAIKEKVFNGIHAAVQSRQLYYTHDGDISGDLADELRQAGFKISVGQQYNETYTSISWDLA